MYALGTYIAQGALRQSFQHFGAMFEATAMSDERAFRISRGRIRSSQAQRPRPFVAKALAAAQKAGGSVSRQGKIGPPTRRF